MNSALITVGIPFYNARSFLGYAISSIINQTYRNWILILLDDGSSDGSLEIAHSFHDQRIQVICDGENKGLAFRLNQFISLCGTKYLVRMDADDIMHPYRLEKQLNYMELHPNVDVLGSYAYSIDTRNRITGLLKVKRCPSILADVFSHQCFIHPSIFVRMDWYLENFYDSEWVRMEDEELWVRTILKSSFANLDEPLLFYREIGLPYLGKYLKSTCGDRMLIKQTNSLLMVDKFKMLIKSYLKTFLFMSFSAFHLQCYLIKRRSTFISVEENKNAIEFLLKAIKM